MKVLGSDYQHCIHKECTCQYFLLLVTMPKKLVIRYNMPLRDSAVILLLSFFLTMIIWIYLDRSQWSYIKSSLSNTERNKQMSQENKIMTDTIAQLNEHIVMLERTIKVEKQTIANLQQNMVKQQNELYEIKNELGFYESVITSFGSVDGLNVQSLRIKEGNQPRNYYFIIILTSVSKDARVLKGQVSILLEGRQADIAKTVDVKDMLISDPLLLAFKLSSFERVTGSIMLPEDFVVHRVIVRAHLNSNKKEKQANVERVFDWSEVLL